MSNDDLAMIEEYIANELEGGYTLEEVSAMVTHRWGMDAREAKAVTEAVYAVWTENERRRRRKVVVGLGAGGTMVLFGIASTVVGTMISDGGFYMPIGMIVVGVVQMAVGGKNLR